MTKKNISIALLVLMIISNVYLIWRVNSNTMAIASYDAGISQRTGIGRFESYWTKYIGAIFKLNQKPKPVKVPLTREEEWERERRRRRRK